MPPTSRAPWPTGSLRKRPRIRRLRERVLRYAEERPGVYRLLGERDRILYVGKSVRLRSRLLSYFRDPKDRKTFELLRATRSVRWDEVPDEFGALLRELHLIRHHLPPFNHRHKHRTRPLFIKVTREPAPRLLLARRPANDGSFHFGPLPSGRWIPRAIHDLAMATGLRDCPARTPMRFTDQLDLLAPSGSAPLCYRGEVGSCPAPCAGRCSTGEYAEGVGEAVAFLQGTRSSPMDATQRALDAATRRKAFELAGSLRDRLDRLERLRSEVVERSREASALTFVYTPPPQAGRGRLYLIRKGSVTLKSSTPTSPSEHRELAHRLHRALETPAPDPNRLDPEQASRFLLVASWFRNQRDERRWTSAPREWIAEGSRPSQA